ncbi:MAG TPA: iron-sulfur cluster repair di-iron protein [Bacillales bacterium]|nr:iron-sulfur cluster repair di-iron protein [Bacillales bacterium]
MEQAFTKETHVGDIVSHFPMASALLKRYRIDFCCGGDRPLREAVEEKELDVDHLLLELNDLYEAAQSALKQQTDWRERSSSELVDHIVGKHHAYLNQVLPELSQWVTKIYRVHGKNHPELKQLHHAYHALKMELESHSIKEEESVFPKIKAFDTAASPAVLEELSEAIEELESEHDAAGDLLKSMRELTGDYQLPPDACQTYSMTFKQLQELESDLFEHIHLENNILFPRLVKSA